MYISRKVQYAVTGTEKGNRYNLVHSVSAVTKFLSNSSQHETYRRRITNAKHRLSPAPCTAQRFTLRPTSVSLLSFHANI